MIKLSRLIIEGYSCNDNCYNRSKCRHWIEEVLNTLKVNYLGELNFTVNHRIIITIVGAESYLCLDTWPEENSFITFEISSCKEFDKDKVAKAFNLFFKPQRMLTKKG